MDAILDRFVLKVKVDPFFRCRGVVWNSDALSSSIQWMNTKISIGLSGETKRLSKM
jgi:hypothetical protein